jgi:hypothetical protein
LGKRGKEIVDKKVEEVGEVKRFRIGVEGEEGKGSGGRLEGL